MTRTVYNQKSHFLLIGSGTTTTYNDSNTKFLLKVLHYILKSTKLFLIQNYFYSNAKKYKLDEILTNFDLTTDSQIEKHYTILIIFKIRIF